jgi:hypothetical protein
MVSFDSTATVSLEVFHGYMNKMLLLLLFRYDEKLKPEAASQLSEVRSYLLFGLFLYISI